MQRAKLGACIGWMSLVMTLASPAHGDPVVLPSDWDESWRFSRSDDQCLLTLGVPSFGQARFVSHANDIVFELQAQRDWFGSAVRLWQVAPAWHPEAGMRQHLGEPIHVQGGGVSSLSHLSDAMLMALREGYDIEVRGHTQYQEHGHLHVRVPAQGMPAAFQQFLDCLNNPLQIAWSELSRTRVEFAVDDADLSTDAQSHLLAIARYLAADEGVAKIYVDGHTDASGTPRKNAVLSKKRAQAVAEFLRQEGVGQELVMRYHGATYPVADNATAEGKARNRRATVRLERSSTGPGNQVARK